MSAGSVARDLAAWAHEQVGPLRARSEEIERARQLPADVARRLAEGGAFRALVPASYGGLELEPQPFTEVLTTLARGDAAAAWCVMTGATTSLLAAYLEPAAARELCADPAAIFAGVIAPMGRATPVAGGYRLRGRWPFASGAHNAGWRMGGALVMTEEGPRKLGDGRVEVRCCFFPAEASRLHDTWDTSGLCGTGSHDLEVEDVFVPESHTTCLLVDEPRVAGALYRFPTFGLLAASIAAVALGIGRSAIDELSSLACEKKTRGGRRSLAEQDLVQVEVAQAEGELAAGRALLAASLDAAWVAAQGGEVEVETRARLRLAATQATRAAVRAVDAMYTAGGGTSLYRRSPLQRHLRDVHTVTQHVMVAPATMKLVGRVLLGVPTDVAEL
ncbi:MAG: acyl-CoA dehydrogenase family protein [Polyangiaceae bacterium]